MIIYIAYRIVQEMLLCMQSFARWQIGCPATASALVMQRRTLFANTCGKLKILCSVGLLLSGTPLHNNHVLHYCVRSIGSKLQLTDGVL